MAYMYKYSLIGILLNFAFMAVSVPSNAYPMTIAATIFSAVGWSFAGIGLFGIQLELLNEEKRTLQLSILSSMPLNDLSIALVAGDAAALTRVPGIGKKTAQRLVLELRDKVDDAELTGQSAAAAAPAGSAESEAIAALMALGYASSEAARAVSAVAGKAAKADEMIFLALKSLGS